MDQELANFTIFQESNEELGLLYQSYNKLHGVINSFMDKIEMKIKKLLNEPHKEKRDLSAEIKQFKSDIDIKLVYHPIEIKRVKATISMVKTFRGEVDRLLTRYAKLKDKIAFGGNYIRGVIIKPKVYAKDIDPEKYEIGNFNIRNVNRAMDWCEKALLDLYNLVDQDLNILTIVNKVYISKHVFESAEEEDTSWVDDYFSEADEEMMKAEIDKEDKKDEEGDEEDGETGTIGAKERPDDQTKTHDRTAQEAEKTEQEKVTPPSNNQQQSTSTNTQQSTANTQQTAPTQNQPEEPEEDVMDDLMNEPVGDTPEEDNSEDNSIEDVSAEVEPDQPTSRPKQVDQAESGKNGVRRKKLYMAFIDWCKEYNSKNTFGSLFDKDTFHVTYPFVPEEMRYFYRLANPMVCVLGGNLTFFQVSELRKLNENNKQPDKYFIFAATLKDIRVFNKEDKRVYFATEKDGNITLGDCLGDSFDIYLQIMIKKGDILNAPLEEAENPQS